MSFTKNLNKLLLVGAVLVGGSINVNSSSSKNADLLRSSVVSPIHHQSEISPHIITDFLKRHSNTWHGQFDISKSPTISPTIRNSISISLSFEDPKELISKEDWGSDVFLQRIFIEQYNKLKQESIIEFSFDSLKGIVFDGNSFETGKNRIMEYCRNEYQKKSLALEVIQDIKTTSEFIFTILNKKPYDFIKFLSETDISTTFASLNLKINAEDILSGEKEYLELTTLTSPERKLLILLFILNKLSVDGSGDCSVALQTLKSTVKDLNFEEFISSCVDLNPYYSSLRKVGMTTLSFSDYDQFFNYDNLVDINILLYTLRYLNRTSISGSIGIIMDNLKGFISNFIANRYNETNPELFAKFADLQNEFLSME